MTISVDAHPCEHQILRVKPLFKRFKASFLYHSFDDFFFGLCSNRMWLKKWNKEGRFEVNIFTLEVLQKNLVKRRNRKPVKFESTW